MTNLKTQLTHDQTRLRYFKTTIVTMFKKEEVKHKATRFLQRFDLVTYF